MAKDKTKKDSKVKTSLTEWQQRNLEFLKRKREREIEQRRQEQEALEATKASLKGQSESEEASQVSEDKPVKVKKEPRIPRRAKLKALPIILGAFLVLVLSGFMISPYSKDKVLKVTGIVNAKAEDIKTASDIKATDYISMVWWQKTQHAKAVETGNEWVKSAQITYQFPKTFTIAVEEYQIVAYTDTEDGYQPILENGKRPNMPAHLQLPEGYIIINLTDEKQIQSLIKQLTSLDERLVQQIESVDLVEGAATKDLLLLGMTGAHQIRVPLSSLSKKLPYYQKIQKKLAEPSIIDMEVGIYTTNETLEAILAQNRLDAAKKSDTEEDANLEESTDLEVTEEETVN